MRGGSVADRIKFAPMAAFAHVRRPGFEPTTRSPIGIYEPDDSGCVDCCSDFGPNIAYVDLKDRKKHGYPVDPEVTPFDGTYLELKQKNELFAEKMNPDSPLFQPINFIWDDPAHPKENGGYVEFVRAMPPKFSESTNLQWDRHSDGKWRAHTLRELHRHQAFPVLDGPRGQGWMSGYVQGQYNLNGVFAFAETSGRVGLLYPDGSIKTIAGFVTDPTKNPVWMRKPMATVRKNQILRGQWSAEGRRAGEDGGFKLPMDVTWDPKDDKVLYVTGFEDHVIWKLEIVDLACDKVNVSVFAGKLDERGDADGKAGAARFDTPSSLIFDPICDCMYVTDQFRGSIRKLTRDATVSTIYGGDNVKPNKVEFPYRPKAMENFSNWHIHSAVYKDGRSTTGAKIKTSAGTKPDLFAPHTIRTTSKGNIMVLDLGFGLIREIDVKTHETVVRTRVYQHMSQYDFGWAWFDLDRWGNSGGLDAIYWTRFTGQVWGNQHGGEAWGDPLCSYGGDGGAIKGLTCGMKDKCLSDCRSYSSAVPDWVCEEPCATDLFAEIYGFTPANNADEKSYMMFTTDRNILPSEGQVQSLDPPHYGWLTAVDPRGALLVGGIGQHGLIRIRKKRATDRTGLDTTQSLKSDQMQTYWQGREIFRKNHKTGLYGRRNEGEQTGVIGLAGVFGYDARNLLGIANAWEIQALSDEAVLDLFRIDKNVRDDAEAKRCVLFFLRHQTGTTSTTKAKTEIVPSQPGQCGSPTPAATTAATTKQTPSGSTKATPKPAVCGNGILEGDEQCDHKDALCCDMECKFKKAGTVCRAAGGECDVADVCTGFDAGCRDKVKDEGESCVASDSTTPTGSRQPDPQCIPPATCDGKTKTCVTPPIGEPLPCDDMKACTTNDQCNLYGLCQGNIGECMCTAADAATVCDDKESCTDDKCVDSKCVSTPLADATACDDNNPCTVNDMCSAGKCQGETSPCPNECSQQGSCKCIDGASKCVCFAGFEGDDCSSATETSCEIGSVFCQCTAGGACDKGLDCAVLPNMEKVCVQTVTSPTDPAISNAALLSVSLLLPVFTLSVACK